MKAKKIPKERNHFVALARVRKAGAHKRSARKLNKDIKKCSFICWVCDEIGNHI